MHAAICIMRMRPCLPPYSLPRNCISQARQNIQWRPHTSGGLLKPHRWALRWRIGSESTQITHLGRRAEVGGAPAGGEGGSGGAAQAAWARWGGVSRKARLVLKRASPELVAVLELPFLHFLDQVLSLSFPLSCCYSVSNAGVLPVLVKPVCHAACLLGSYQDVASEVGNGQSCLCLGQRRGCCCKQKGPS